MSEEDLWAIYYHALLGKCDDVVQAANEADAAVRQHYIRFPYDE